MTSETIGKIRKGWDGTALIGYAILAFAFAVACGYSISSWHNQKSIAAMAETARVERQELTDRFLSERDAIIKQFIAERDDMVKANKLQLNYLRKQLRSAHATIANQSDQLAKVGEKGVEAARQSSELGKQILQESTK